MTEKIEIKINSLVYEGYGLGRLADGRAAFVPFVLPGETVHARIIEVKRGHVLCELITVTEPHPDRILPRCGHFGVCGGCHYQQIPYQLQQEIKKSIFREQLQRIAGIESPVIKALSPPPQKWDYRNSLQFSLSNEGNLSFADFHHNRLFKVTECHLPMAAISAIWPMIEFERGITLNRVEFRQNTEGDLMLILRSQEKELPELETELSASVVHVCGEDAVVMAGNDHLIMRLMDKDFRVSAGSFFQTNFGAAEILAREVCSIVQERNCNSIMDVFCGVGLFSAFLADKANKVIGVESSITACSDFAKNLDAYDHVVLYQAKAEEILPFINEKPDCIIVDPPRAGLKREIIRALAEKKPDLIIYVSCNPSTLARDVMHLCQSGYQLESSILVDMFPQTFHIESINIFSKF